MSSGVFINLYVFYGLFLMTCAVTAFIFIGPKAKTALSSGGISGLLSLLVAYLYWQQNVLALPMGIGLSLILILVFSWRCTVTLITVFEWYQLDPAMVKPKLIAFLLIGLMAIMSLLVFFVRIVF
jgi:Mg/Co/Ni transporter MgtE